MLAIWRQGLPDEDSSFIPPGPAGALIYKFLEKGHKQFSQG